MRGVTARSLTSRFVLTSLLCLVSAPGPSAAQSGTPTMDPSLLEGMEYRSVGPFRGGRVTAVGGFADRPYSFLMGTTGGGVWLTEDAGETWENITDGFLDVGSVGAVTVAPSDPNVVYVGTGSAGIRGNISTGRGVWRSTDRGKTWTFVGLRDAGLIGKIEVDPRNPDVAFVAALGNAFGKNPERGVFRTRDGGASWEKVLFVSDSTGAVDLAMNPANPRVIYAGMWRAERKPWTLIDASEDGGVWKTTDGGDTWAKLEGGLPEGLTGRIGLAIAPERPDRVWALVNAADPGGGIYRSEDAGKTWRKINRDRRFRQRHWYYTHLIPDPADPNTLYVLNTGMYRSVDAGVTWERISVPHGDVHGLWIHPENPDAMVVGNDGGAQVSLTGGLSWSTMHNQPTAEFYRVEVDNQWPYRLYGAQQDNSTISVSSAVAGDLTPEQDWMSVGGAESGHISVHPHPDSAQLVWAGNYIGQIDRSNLETGWSRNMILYPQMGDGVAPRDMKYRFQWNAPIIVSRHDPGVVYHASQFVHRTTNGGMSWETISPDLTTNNPEQQGLPGGPLQHDHTGVEVYNTVFVLSESPQDAGELWAGTDDGRVHITRDGGSSWTEITPARMPSEGTVNSIDLNPNRPGRAVMAVYRYRDDDFRPYVFLTDNFGEDWELLTDGTNGIPADFPVRVVREDPDREGLFYAGTEFGMFVSFDNGSSWQEFQQNLPRTPITDLKVHRNDLVVATQGRSFWILDDLTRLHEMHDDIRTGALHVFQPRDPTLARLRGFRGDRAPENPAGGAVVHFWLGEDVTGEVEVEIIDPSGTVIAEYEGQIEGDGDAEHTEGEGDEEDEDELPEHPGLEEGQIDVSAGMNRVEWNLTYPGPDVIETAQFSLAYTGGAIAPPGEYQVRISAGGSAESVTFTVRRDPRIDEVSSEDLLAQFQLSLRVRDRLTEVHDAIRTIRSVRAQTAAFLQRMEEAGFEDSVVSGFRDRAEAIDDALKPEEEALIQTKNETGQDPINFPPMLDDQLAYLYSHVTTSYGRPTEGAYQRHDDLVAETQVHLDRIDEVMETLVAEFNEALAAAGIPPVVVGPRNRLETPDRETR
jgi:photosystem II stability/assembly factor-like uncharacterized protein